MPCSRVHKTQNSLPICMTAALLVQPCGCSQLRHMTCVTAFAGSQDLLTAVESAREPVSPRAVNVGVPDDLSTRSVWCRI